MTSKPENGPPPNPPHPRPKPTSLPPSAGAFAAELEQLEALLAGRGRWRRRLIAAGRVALVAAAMLSAGAGWWGLVESRAAGRRADDAEQLVDAAVDLAVELEQQAREARADAAAARRAAADAIAAAELLLELELGRRTPARPSPPTRSPRPGLDL